MNYDSPNEIISMLESHGIKLKKRWGQNFLINRGAREKIVDLLELEEGELVWEIGPGLGSLTSLLLERNVHVVVFEIDRGLCRVVEEELGNSDRLGIVCGDFVKEWKKLEKRPNKILGNLPYSSASQIMVSMIKEGFVPPLSVYTLQKDMVKRMTAKPGTKDYSSFSVLCQYAMDIKVHGDLNPGSFFPRPEVISTVITVTPRVNIERAKNEALFFTLVKALFSSRRKTLRNNLLTERGLRRYKKSLLLRAVEMENISTGIRSEELPVESFVRIADRIEKLVREK